MPYPHIDQLFLVPGKTNIEIARWGAAVLEYAALFPGIYISHDYAEAGQPQYDRITIVNPDDWPEDLWFLIKQNPRPLIVEPLVTPTPEVLAEILHARTDRGLRFGFQTEEEWSEQWSDEVCLIGLHGRGDGEMQGADIDLVRTARIEAVKLTSYATSNSIKALRAVNPNMFIVVRPITSFVENGRARHISADEFVYTTINDLARLLDYDPAIEFVEVHNEPNLTIEGLGGAWSNGREFASWFDRVVELYRQRWPTKKYGFPGLSPGVLNQHRLVEMKQFLNEAALSVARADWISVHGYWGTDREVTEPEYGFTWKTYRQMFPDQLLMITEFGNPIESKPVVAEQYSRYYGMLRHVSGLAGAFAYISSVSDRTESARWAWRDENGKDVGIAAEVGARRYIQ